MGHTCATAVDCTQPGAFDRLNSTPSAVVHEGQRCGERLPIPRSLGPEKIAQYGGEWVAVASEEIAAHGKDPRRVHTEAYRAGKGMPFMDTCTRIPRSFRPATASPMTDAPSQGWTRAKYMDVNAASAGRAKAATAAVPAVMIDARNPCAARPPAGRCASHGPAGRRRMGVVHADVGCGAAWHCAQRKVPAACVQRVGRVQGAPRKDPHRSKNRRPWTQWLKM